LSISAHFCTYRAFEALLAIFEQGKRNWAVVDVCARGNKDGSKYANDRYKKLHI
jgi:hypothetical protein